MKGLFVFAAIAGLFFPAAHAQIYADFTVSHGGTPLGTFRARLEYDKVPRVCANFIGLATGRRAWIAPNGTIKSGTPFYDGKLFHRLDHNFVIQGGSPNNTSSGLIGYSFLDQYHPDLRHSGRYMLSMAKSNQPNTNGAQFFITLAPAPALDDKHSVFGEVISGKEIIDAFTNPALFPVSGESPISPIVMESVTISGPSLAAFNIEDPALGLPHVIHVPLTGTRNTASTFRLEFPRQAKTAYQVLDSVNLETWGSVLHLFHLGSAPPTPFTISGVEGPRYFSRVTGVSFADVPNAPSDLVSNGKKLVLTRRNGYQITLTFNGSGGGSWTDGTSSGTLSSVVWRDYVGASGAYSNSVAFGHEVAFGDIQMNFSAPGPDSITQMSAYVSFHTPNTGFLEEISSTTPPNRFRFGFVWTP